jgi:hypothetical protein
MNRNCRKCGAEIPPSFPLVICETCEIDFVTETGYGSHIDTSYVKYCEKIEEWLLPGVEACR